MAQEPVWKTSFQHINDTCPNAGQAGEITTFTSAGLAQ